MIGIKKQLEGNNFKEVDLHKSAGILDDFAVRKTVNTRELDINKFKMKPGAGAAKVLTSDADGNGTWEVGGGGITDHDDLNNLAWSIAGHTIDADIDMNSNDIKEVASMEVVGSGKVEFRDGEIYINSNADGQMTLEADTQINITAPLSMNSNKITNVTDCTTDQDAATKKYVDGQITGAAVTAATIAANLDTQLIANYGLTSNLHENGATINGNMILGNFFFEHSTFIGNATERKLATSYFPIFSGIKAKTALQGSLWNYHGHNKGSAVANLIGSVLYPEVDGLTIGTLAATNTNLTNYTDFFISAISADSQWDIVTGSYTGNATDNTDIEIGVAPAMVIVKGEEAQSAVFRTTNHAANSCSYFLINTADVATGIKSFGATNFRIGNGATANSNLVKYNYIAFYDKGFPANKKVCATVYTCTGLGNGQCVSLPFHPRVIFAMPSAANACMFWTDSMTARNTAYISSATANSTTDIIKVTDKNFVVGVGTGLSAINNVVSILAIE